MRGGRPVDGPTEGGNTMSAATDRIGSRRERRQGLVRRVEYSAFPRVKADQRERTGFTRDVSPSGLCLRTDVAEPTGSLLRLVVRDVDGRPTLESLARVAWRRPTEEGTWWLGLALLEGRRQARIRPPARLGDGPRRSLGSGA